MTIEMGKPITSAVQEAENAPGSVATTLKTPSGISWIKSSKTDAARSYVRFQPLGQCSPLCLEFSFLAGVSLRCPCFDGGKRRLAQARFERAAMRPRYRRHFPPGGVS